MKQTGLVIVSWREKEIEGDRERERNRDSDDNVRPGQWHRG